MDGVADQTHYVVGVVVELSSVSVLFRALVEEECTFISNNNHMSSIPGCARYSSKSINRGIGSCGSFSVFSLLRNSESQSISFSGRPKHLFKSLSYTKSVNLSKSTWQTTNPHVTA